MSLSHLELMEIEAEALFTYDSHGRMLTTNEPDGDPAPRFFLGRTKDGNIWRVRYDLPGETIRALELLAEAEPIAADLSRPPTGAAGFLATLQGKGGQEASYFGPAFYFPDEIPDASDAVLITEANVHLLFSGFPDMLGPAGSELHPANQPVVAVVQDGRAVSICFCSRLTARAAEAGLETLAGYRGRGYATAAVAGWARAVRARGLAPLYGTTWDNLASQAVANKLGCILYGSDWSV